MASIPLDITYDILLRLPVKSLVRFKCICKPWKHLIESSSFIRSHLYRSLQPSYGTSSSLTIALISPWGSSLYVVDDGLDSNTSSPPRELVLPTSFQRIRIEFVGSYNGLLCIQTREMSNTRFLLCNPSSNYNNPSSFKILPRLINYNDNEQQCFLSISGFGYDYLDDDYKVLCGNNTEMVLYSSKADSWKSTSMPRRFSIGWSTNNVLVNNSLHWIVPSNKIIFRFDLHDEQWYEVDIPDRAYSVCYIGVFEGCLSLTLQDFSDGEDSVLELWVMREYNVKESWTRLFTLPITTMSVLYYSAMRQQVLLITEDYNGLAWYSPHENRIVQWVEIPDVDVMNCSDIKTFVGSLVYPGMTMNGEDEEATGNQRGGSRG